MAGGLTSQEVRLADAAFLSRQRNPGTDVGVKQMSHKLQAHSKGVRLANFAQIRAVIDEELEAVWDQRKTPKEALDSAVVRGNDLLRRFERGGKG